MCVNNSARGNFFFRAIKSAEEDECLPALDMCCVLFCCNLTITDIRELTHMPLSVVLKVMIHKWSSSSPATGEDDLALSTNPFVWKWPRQS